jgi:hypothetical protein
VVVRVDVVVEVLADSHEDSLIPSTADELAVLDEDVVEPSLVVTTVLQPLPSAATAAVRGPPRMAAVRPPPASADTIVRHARRRALICGGVRRNRSSFGRPMIVVGAATHDRGGRPWGFISTSNHDPVKES